MGQPTLKDMTVAAINALETNQNAQGLEFATRALTQYPAAGHLQRLAFVMAAERAMVPAIMDQLKKAIEITLDYDDVENQRLFPGWFYIFQKSPQYMPFLDKPLDWAKIDLLSQDKFLILGLRKLNFLDWNLEDIFTRLRRKMLLEYLPKDALKTRHLSFLCALAEHCYYNGYVFRVEADELQAVEGLIPDDPITVALIGCYKPLADVAFDEKMSAVSGFRAMVKSQVTNIRHEHNIELTEGPLLRSGVSKTVQAMYEEDPYPRWISINMPYRPVEDVTGDVLLAGCGTGQMALGISAALPNCNFTAIDISRRSLAYAARMADVHGIENITFAQCDILDAQSLGHSFDYIECSGVLHHMEDPEAGWRALASCLKSGGGMQAALYATKTRGNINKVKDLIAEKSYSPVRADIRKLRADIAALAEDDPRREVFRMRDFYSISMTRDLVFHIQEKSYDLPEIAAMMERLRLAFDGFKIHDGVKHAYRARFKDDPAMTNLEYWNIFETENPDTFVGMYRIFCHKKGDAVSETVRRIREMQV